MTRSEFIRRLNDVAFEPTITACESMLINAVCALWDHAESQLASYDMRRLAWIGTYIAELTTSRATENASRRTHAKAAAAMAVADYDAFIATEAGPPLEAPR